MNVSEVNLWEGETVTADALKRVRKLVKVGSYVRACVELVNGESFLRFVGEVPGEFGGDPVMVYLNGRCSTSCHNVPVRDGLKCYASSWVEADTLAEILRAEDSLSLVWYRDGASSTALTEAGMVGDLVYLKVWRKGGKVLELPMGYSVGDSRYRIVRMAEAPQVSLVADVAPAPILAE